MRGLSSVMRAAHVSSLCGGSLLGARGFAWRFSFEKRMRLRTREGYPQSCAARMTAPSAEGAKGDSASAEAAKGLCDRPLETFAPCGGDSWQVTAALSAAVTTTKPIRDCPHSQAEPTMQKRTPPNASRSSGEGGWGRGASLREAASPPESPPTHVSSGGSAREGASLQRSPLPR